MAASTIGTNVRGWREVSSAAHWTARCLHDTGTSLYAVVQDTGATPKIRVMKADSRTAPTTWTEQDSADNKAITNVDYPFSSWLHTNGDLHIVAFSATNTLTHYVFDTDTDQWATGNGNISTAVENEHTVRCCVRSDGDILAFFTSNADDADLGWFVWQGANWSTGGVTGILSANSTGASNVLDAGIDSTDRAWVVFYDPSAGDVSYVTVDSANTVAAVTDIDATGPANLNQNTGARYALYDDAGTDTIVAAYRPQAIAIEERVVTLEADADAANLAAEVSVEATTTDVGTRTPVSTAVVGGVPYCAWWDDATSGTIKYTTKSGGAWATETDWKTGITKLIEIVPVDTDGLAGVYQSSNDVLADWIVAPSGVVHATGTVAAGSLSVSGQTVTGTADSLATVATGSHAVSGQTVTADPGATGVVATGSHAVSGQAVSGVGGALATIGTGSHAVSGQTVTGTEGGAPVTGTIDTGSLAVAGQAVTGLAGSLGTVATGSHTVSGQAVTGTEGPTPATGEIASGTLAVSGQSVTAQTGSLASVATGSHAVSAQAVTAASGTAATVSTGTLAAVGQIVAASVDELASLIVGTLAVSGQPIAASAETVATIATGSLFVDGQAVIGITHVAGDLSFRLDADRVLSYLVSGTAVLAFTPAADRVLTFHEGAE